MRVFAEKLMKQSRLTAGAEAKNEISRKVHLLNCIVNGKRSLICEMSPKTQETSEIKAQSPTNFMNVLCKKFIEEKSCKISANPP